MRYCLFNDSQRGGGRTPVFMKYLLCTVLDILCVFLHFNHCEAGITVSPFTDGETEVQELDDFPRAQR